MALIRPFTTADGTHYPEAYSRVVTVRVDKNLGYVFVCTYADEDSRLLDASPIFAEEHSSLLAVFNGDVLVNAYSFLKTMPGFEDAVDHLPDPVPPVTLVVDTTYVTHPPQPDLDIPVT
jgi:hypothetical protein